MQCRRYGEFPIDVKFLDTSQTGVEYPSEMKGKSRVVARTRENESEPRVRVRNRSVWTRPCADVVLEGRNVPARRKG